MPQADDCRVESIINNKFDKIVRWKQGCYEDEQVHCAVQGMLQQELAIDSAVQIALLNNFEEIGIAQADLVQAGLFQNPVFDGYVRFPDHHSLHWNLKLSLQQTKLNSFVCVNT